jgi:hypothetical protein
VAIAGGYNSEKQSDYQHYLYENKNGTYIKTLLPVPPFIASIIRPFDYDYDGYKDLFIFSRVTEKRFPFANDSWFINNNKGKLTVDSTSRFNLGMVTDAVWTDYDNDGWEDLLVTREYNSLVLLKNMNGKKLVPQEIPTLENKHGIWYSITAGDFDKDGDDDYIFGNLGENNQFKVSDKYPLNLYAFDIDMNGTLDPIRTAFWEDKTGEMKEYPINYLDELGKQSSFFEKKFENYTSFSFATINNILDREMLESTELKLHVNTTSSYILWNNAGKFRWEKLPVSMQLSPIRKIIVEDFNGDNYPDVLLGGNDYTYDVATGYYDANKGITLLNKGKNQEKDKFIFEVLKPSRSGILLHGMVTSLIYFKGSPSMVVAGFNRSNVVVFEHIKN